MRGRGKWLLVVLGLIMLTLASTAQAAPAESSKSSNRPRPQTLSVTSIQSVDSTPRSVPCALGGAGEYVQLTGDQTVKLKTTTYPNGAYKLKLSVRFNNVTGTGLTSGEPYQVSSSEKYIEQGVASFPLELYYRLHFRMVGAWSRTKMTVYERVKQSFDADGNLVFNSTIDKMDCRILPSDDD